MKMRVHRRLASPPRKAKTRTRVAAALLAVAGLGATAVVSAVPAYAVEGHWSTVGCGAEETSPVIPEGSFVKVMITGAPGTWAWGINGGSGHAGGNGSQLVITSADRTYQASALTATAGCTSPGSNSEEIPAGAGWAPGGKGQRGGGSGGGASALCHPGLGDGCDMTVDTMIAVAGGGGGGGGGTCTTQKGWNGGDAGAGALSEYLRKSYLNGADGYASPGSGARITKDTGFDTYDQRAGADWVGGQGGGAAGGGGGIVGGGAGSTHGYGCETGGGGGGGASYFDPRSGDQVRGPWVLKAAGTSSAGGSVEIIWRSFPPY